MNDPKCECGHPKSRHSIRDGHCYEYFCELPFYATIKMMEVRCCCCDAGKILGYLPVPRGCNPVRFLLIPELRSARAEPDTTGPEMEYVTLEVGYVCGGGYVYHLALKSNHVPIETLRRIPGFVEYEP